MRSQTGVALALVLAMAAPAAAANTKAAIDVPGSALNMGGDFAGRPDPGGGFTVGVATTAVPIDASKCRTGLLSVDMSGVRPAASGAFTTRQQSAIKKRLVAYARLQDAQKSNTTVTLHLDTDPRYLFFKNGKLTAPYCSVTIDSVEARP